MLRRLATIYAVVAVSGAAMVKTKPVEAPEEPDECDVDDEMNKAIAFEPPEVCDLPGAGFREASRSASSCSG